MSEPVHDYEGKERRKSTSLPYYEIMTEIDSRLATHADKVEGMFKEHIQEEEAAFDALRSEMGALGRQYQTLCNTITDYLRRDEQFYADVRSGFPTGADGKPDFSGHARAHEAMIKTSDENDELMNFVRQKMDEDKNRAEDIRFIRRALIVAAAGAFLLWAAKALWIDGVSAAQITAAETKK